ncbi:MAG: hypothetical protein Q8K55_13675 [Gemmatimonadaceae bacterium]|nr:hypothetical protein [Gemmatimonadaceae bacterium]
MPADYLINRNLGVVFSQAWGVLTDTDLLEHQRRLAKDLRFQPDFNQIFSFEDVTVVEVTPAGIQTLAERTLFGAGSRRAFVVQPGAMKMFGLMRMFEILTAEHPDKLRVQFDHLAMALEWIGVPTPDK